MVKDGKIAGFPPDIGDGHGNGLGFPFPLFTELLGLGISTEAIFPPFPGILEMNKFT